MICPDCAYRMEVERTMPTLDGVQRVHRCPCGGRFLTVETIAGRLPSAAGSHGYAPAATGSSSKGDRLLPVSTGVQRPPPVRTGTPPVAGGVGGGLSGDPSGSDPDPDPDSSLLSDPRARARCTRNASYPAAFEAAWEATDKTGSKWRALAAWKRHGRPAPEVIAAGWKRWKATDQWQRGIVPHVSTWINGRCFEQTPAEVPRAPAPAPWEERQARARREAAERDRIASQRGAEAVDRKVAELRRFQRPPSDGPDVAGTVAALANAKGVA